MNEKHREIAEVLMDFGNALESAAVNLKRYVADLLNEPANPVWDPDRIHWTKAESSKGEYEKATAEANRDCVDFDNLVQDLKLHNGKLSRLGFFYWLFEKTSTLTVGRKPSRRKM